MASGAERDAFRRLGDHCCDRLVLGLGEAEPLLAWINVVHIQRRIFGLRSRAPATQQADTPGALDQLSDERSGGGPASGTTLIDLVPVALPATRPTGREAEALRSTATGAWIDGGFSTRQECSPEGCCRVGLSLQMTT